MSPTHTIERIERSETAARRYADAGNPAEAWRASAPLRKTLDGDRNAGLALVRLVDAKAFAREQQLEAVQAIFAAHSDDDEVVGRLGSALESVHDINFLNGPAPADPVFTKLAEHLRARLGDRHPTRDEDLLLGGLATTARLLGRAWDDDAERAHRRRIALYPSQWERHYDLGLFLKTRGRFAEGITANQRAAALGGADNDGVVWNLGICATGAREGATALATWKRAFDHNLKIGRFDLPEGPYDMVKVRLAEYPLAVRGATVEGPGREESVWIERLSPCHGVVRSALYYDIGVDFGDAVLFDGAPITHHKYGDDEVPVFPHLVTLEHTNHLIVRFAATQRREGGVSAVDKRLSPELMLYAHTEQVAMTCAACWLDSKRDHAKHREMKLRVVTGKLCAPPGADPKEIRRVLDEALDDASGVRLFVPDLSRLAGDEERAETETRRMEMLARCEPVK